MLSPVDEIKSRLDIVELIQSYIRLQKAGANFKALCPFHSEKTASFNVSPARQIWHCFGCGKGGDVFKFVMEIEGHDFPEALRALAQRAGVALKREDPSIRSERNRLYDLCEEAAKIFEQCLMRTPAAKNYLLKRGVSEGTINKFRIGFAPQAWDFLLKSLAGKRFAKEEMEKAGLAIRSEDKSSWYDRFRSRIIFPITDNNGRVIGFGGRIFETEESRNANQESGKNEAKYINTPNTLIYDKSRALYGFDKAKEAIRQKNQAVIVEGYMDCVMSHQAGATNTVAVSGTALTPQQLRILRRLCDTLIFSFDTDAAGDSATRRSLSLAAEFEFERKIAAIPSSKDPADAVKENPRLWLDAVENGKSSVAFYFDKVFSQKKGATVEDKKESVAVLLPFIAEIPNEIERAHWVSELAKRLNTSDESIRRELIRTRVGVNSRAPAGREKNDAARQMRRKELLEERILMLLAAFDEKLRQSLINGATLLFSSEARENLYQSMRDYEKNAPTGELKELLESFCLRGEMLLAELSDAEGEFRICARELERECVRERLAAIETDMAKREREGNFDAVTTLLEDFKSASAQLKNLS